MRASVSAQKRATPRILRDDLPAANGIIIHQDRLSIDENRPNGRLVELDLSARMIRTLAENLPFPNALEVGPDGLLYFPVMAANEIWRINPNGDESERVVVALRKPDAVKFDSNGGIVSTQLETGQVLRIDPQDRPEGSAGATRAAARQPAIHWRTPLRLALLGRTNHGNCGGRWDPICHSGRLLLAAGVGCSRRWGAFHCRWLLAQGSPTWRAAADDRHVVRGRFSRHAARYRTAR